MAERALHLQAGCWVASCPSCGHELASHPDQGTAEQLAADRPCPNGCPDDLDLEALAAGIEPGWLADAADAARQLDGHLDADERERLRRLGSLP